MESEFIKERQVDYRYRRWLEKKRGIRIEYN